MGVYCPVRRAWIIVNHAHASCRLRDVCADWLIGSSFYNVLRKRFYFTHWFIANWHPIIEKLISVAMTEDVLSCSPSQVFIFSYFYQVLQLFCSKKTTFDKLKP